MWRLPTVKRMLLSPRPGMMTAVYFAKATPTAAMVPVWMTMKNVQP